jgi:hypothetical protein
VSFSTSFVGAVLVFGWVLLFNVPSLEFLGWLLITIGYILLFLQVFVSYAATETLESFLSGLWDTPKVAAAFVALFVEIIALVVMLTTVNWADSEFLRAIDFENPDAKERTKYAEERRDLNQNKALSVAIACLVALCFALKTALPTWLPQVLGPYINMDITPSLSFFLGFFGVLAIVCCYQLGLGINAPDYKKMWLKGNVVSLNNGLLGVLSTALALVLVRDAIFYFFLPYRGLKQPVAVAYVFDFIVDVFAFMSLCIYFALCAAFVQQETPATIWLVTYLFSLTALYVFIYGQQQYMTTAVAYVLEHGLPFALAVLSLVSLSNAGRIADMFRKELAS